MAAPKSKKNQKPPRDGRGGDRPGAGRKPKAVTELRRAAVAAIAGGGELPAASREDAASYAFRLIVGAMRDESVKLPVRLECAAEVLNRVWGKPAPAPPRKADDGGSVTAEKVREAQAIREARARRGAGDGDR